MLGGARAPAGPPLSPPLEPRDMERHGAAAVAVRLRRRLHLLHGLRLRLLQLQRLLVLISFPRKCYFFFSTVECPPHSCVFLQIHEHHSSSSNSKLCECPPSVVFDLGLEDKATLLWSESLR